MISKLRNEDVQFIMTGRESSYFLLKNGVVKACGRNDEGQLGDGTFVDNEYATVDIPHGNAITSIGSGSSAQSVFFFGQTSVFGAGANDRFQLGIGEVGCSGEYCVYVNDFRQVCTQTFMQFTSQNPRSDQLSNPQRSLRGHLHGKCRKSKICLNSV
jgi:hypothetical protein